MAYRVQILSLAEDRGRMTMIQTQTLENHIIVILSTGPPPWMNSCRRVRTRRGAKFSERWTA